jgi:hypothetical protein
MADPQVNVTRGTSFVPDSYDGVQSGATWLILV